MIRSAVGGLNTLGRVYWPRSAKPLGFVDDPVHSHRCVEPRAAMLGNPKGTSRSVKAAFHGLIEALEGGIVLTTLGGKTQALHILHADLCRRGLGLQDFHHLGDEGV